MKRTHIQALGALAFVLSATLLIPAGRASAHAAYDRSTPARDEVVAAPPAQVDVYFKEDVFKQQGAYYVRVFNDNAAQVSTGDGTVDDNNRKHIFATLPSSIADGRYIVRWMTTSFEDGDTDQGAFCFYLAVQPKAAQQTECAAFATPTATPGAGPTATQAESSTATAATTTATMAAATPTQRAPAGKSSGGGTPTAAIVGGIIGGVVLVIVVGGGVAVWLRRTMA